VATETFTTRASTRSRSHRLLGGRRRTVPNVILRHIILIVLLIALLYPVVWLLFSSFGPSAEIFVRNGLLRGTWTTENYVQGWNPLRNLSFGRLFLNSIVIAVLSILGTVISCTMAAYAFARLNFAMRSILFGFMLVTIMLPQQVLIIPQYILFQHLGWLNTYLPLIVPRFLAVDGFFVFLMVQFIRGLPRELDEAARIDGAGHAMIFVRIVLPLAAPAMATVALFSFLEAWNDFLGPLLYLTDPSNYTVPLGLNLFLDSSGNGGSQWGPLFAMCVLSLVPLIAVFLATQRLLTQGIATTGMKG
jgi:multiple sugar transport system permease protein